MSFPQHSLLSCDKRICFYVCISWYSLFLLLSNFFTETKALARVTEGETDTTMTERCLPGLGYLRCVFACAPRQPLLTVNVSRREGFVLAVPLCEGESADVADPRL